MIAEQFQRFKQTLEKYKSDPEITQLLEIMGDVSGENVNVSGTQTIGGDFRL